MRHVFVLVEIPWSVDLGNYMVQFMFKWSQGCDHRALRICTTRKTIYWLSLAFVVFYMEVMYNIVFPSNPEPSDVSRMRFYEGWQFIFGCDDPVSLFCFNIVTQHHDLQLFTVQKFLFVCLQRCLCLWRASFRVEVLQSLGILEN